RSETERNERAQPQRFGGAGQAAGRARAGRRQADVDAGRERLPSVPARRRSMRRGRVGTLAASPTLVGAVTVLVVVVAVFLSYQANQGLPFVPTYKLSAQLPNAETLVPGNEVRIGGQRVGQIKSVEPETIDNAPCPNDPEQECRTEVAKVN